VTRNVLLHGLESIDCYTFRVLEFARIHTTPVQSRTKMKSLA